MFGSGIVYRSLKKSVAAVPGRFNLEWLVMPALIHQQFYLFRDRQQSAGLAMWAKYTPESVAKLDRGMNEPESRLTHAHWNSAEPCREFL